MKRMIKMLSGILLSLTTVLGLMPGMSMTAYADTHNPTSTYTGYDTLITNDTEVTINEVSGVVWYVIEYDSTAKTVTLLSKQPCGNSTFNSESTINNNYNGSVVKGYVEGLTGTGQPLAGIKEALANVNVTDPAVTGTVPYLLSTSEAGSLSETKKKGDVGSTSWWLRSPGSIGYGTAAYVGGNGEVYGDGSDVRNVKEVRPALKLDLSKVIFSAESNTFSLTAAVNLTGGANASSSGGNLQQEVNAGNAMETVTFTAGTGYQFPATSDLYTTTSGITVERTSDTVVTVSGTPTDIEVNVKVPDAFKPAAKVTTAPTAKELTYTGSAQELVEAGTATGGTMQYALGTETEATEAYSTSIPTGTDAGTYYVWYKAKGDDSHSDSTPEKIEVVIKGKGDPESEVIKKEGNISIRNSAETLKILNNSLPPELKEKVEKAAADGKEVEFVFKSKDLGKDAEGAKDIEEYDKENGLTLGQLLDITLIVKIDGDEIGKITETGGKITFEVEIPEDLREDGRMFYILKFHDNSVSEVGKGKGPKVKAATDEFSTYALAYKDGGSKDKDDDKDDDHEDHTPPSWVLNPNEKQQLVITFTGTPAGLTAGYQEQGKAAQALFDTATPAGWKKAFSFNLLNKERRPEMSLKNGTLKLYIPTEYQKAGRQFAILAMGKNGQVIFLPDTDTEPKTITVNLAYEGYAMELIYKD